MKNYINTKLKDSSQILYEIAQTNKDIEIELTDDIFVSYYFNNPWKLEVREGLDGDVKEYNISDEIDDLLKEYGTLFIEDIR